MRLVRPMQPLRIFATQWAQMIANGKVQGQDMMSIINVFPEMKNQLKEVAGQELGIANMTQEQYAKLQSDGKITAEMAQKALFELQDKYKDATANFSTTIGGLERTIQSRMPAVVAAFRDPIDKMKKPILTTDSGTGLQTLTLREVQRTWGACF